LDPLADKLMIGTLCLSMGNQGLLPAPLVFLIFGRDLILISGTLYHRYQTKTKHSDFFQTDDLTSFQVKPSAASKINTFLQFVTLGGALFNAAYQIPGEPVITMMLYVYYSPTRIIKNERLIHPHVVL
jgi:phosphatidylglycerophosphate synthase